MKRDHHMRQKGELWFVQIAIPEALRPHYDNRKIIERSLGTKDPVRARLKRDAFLVKHRAEFERLRKADVSIEADEEVRTYEAAVRTYSELQRNPHLADKEMPFDNALLNAKDREDFLGIQRGHELFNRSIPLPQPPPRPEKVDSFIDDFLTAKQFSAAHAANTRRAITKFAAWMEARDTKPILGNVTREIAGDYLAQAGGGPKTLVNIVLMISSYFAWLVKPRAKMVNNPFEGLSGSIENIKQARIKKRPFTQEEISRLLLDAPADLSDAIRILALSGMRASELCSLTVADCRGDVFRVHGGPDDEERKGKTPAAKREIPIHIDISRTVNDRRRARAGTELLFPKWNGKSRGLCKRFYEHRIKCNVNDRKKGQRQSRIDLHSLRRWFAAKAMEALAGGASGFTAWTVADVLGHDRESLTLPMTSKYASLSPIEERRSCVGSVQLPRIRPSQEKTI